MATIANTNIVYVIQTANTGEGQTSNVFITYAGPTVNGVVNATAVGVSVDYSEILERIANSSSTTASNLPINYSTSLGYLSRLLDLTDSADSSANSLQTIANEFVKFNNSINVFLGYVSTIKNTVLDISNTQSDISNTQSAISNTMLIVQDDISEITNRANTRTKGIWVNNDANTPFTRAQSRALAVAAVKESGGLERLSAEINNPTSLPGDEA